jgi:hypothetical protein
MAQGTLTVFNEAKKNISGLVDLQADTFKVMLVTTLPAVGTASPDTGDFTEVTGGTSYVAGGISVALTWVESGGTVTCGSITVPTWVKDVSGPTNIVAAIVYSTVVGVGAGDALAFIDMTTDAGATPISLQTGDISITFNGSGLFTLA